MSIDYNQLPAPPEGDLPAFWKGTNPGDFVEGVIVDVRIVKHAEYGDAPCLDIQTGVDPATGQPAVVPVLASTQSLYRQVYNLRPEVGGRARVTFQGFQGRAKLYQLDYQPGVAGTAPVAAPPAPAPAPTVAPAGFGDANASATPWAQPTAPTAPPATPWGQG